MMLIIVRLRNHTTQEEDVHFLFYPTVPALGWSVELISLSLSPLSLTHTHTQFLLAFICFNFADNLLHLIKSIAAGIPK